MPQSGLVVTAGSDFSVRIWNANGGEEVLRLAGHLGDIYDAHFSPNGKLLATSSSDGMVLLWDTTVLQELGRRSISESVRASGTDAWQRPSTILTSEERKTTAAFQGRLLEWRDLSSPNGVIQTVRAILVRWFGWSLFDYKRPE
jgi:WD40 repeat protein